MPPSPGPLAGLTVLELTSTFLGPYCAVLMAQMGARVVKVEPPAGDIIRGVGDENGSGLGPAFLNFNRGKESVVLDLTTPAGREALDLLVEHEDGPPEGTGSGSGTVTVGTDIPPARRRPGRHGRPGALAPCGHRR